MAQANTFVEAVALIKAATSKADEMEERRHGRNK